MSLGRGVRLLLGAGLVVVGLLVVVVALLLATNPAPRDTSSWMLRAPLAEGRGEVAVAVADGRLYVIGGLAGAPSRTADEMAVYDPARDAWTDGPRLPGGRHHTAAAGLDGTVYVSGGADRLIDWQPLANLWALEPASAAWRELPPMPEGRYGHRMVALDGRLYVVGGRGGSGAVLVFDPENGQWTMGAPMPVVRDHLAAVVVGGEIWTIGGRNGGLSAAVDVYDQAADEWRAGPPLPAVTSGAAEAAGEGLVLVSGGEDPSPTGAGVFDRHWWLDTADVGAGWRALPLPPFAVHGAQGAVIDGAFYVVGGATRAGAMSSLAWSSALQVLELSELQPD